MSSVFGGLTKYGVNDGGGNTQFYNTPSAASDAFTGAVGNASIDALTNGTRNIPVSLLPEGAQGDVSFRSTNEAPSLVKPGFIESAYDKYGNVNPKPAAMTKKGKLFSLLLGGLQGGTDAVQGGALDAVPGRSNFGAGMQAAYQLPILRQQQALQTERAALQNEATRAEMADIPLIRAHRRSQIEANLANAEYDRARMGELGKPKPPEVKGTVEGGLWTADANGNVKILREPKQKPAAKPNTYTELVLAFNEEQDPVVKSIYAQSIKDIERHEKQKAALSRPESESDVDRKLRRDVDEFSAKLLAKHGNDANKAMGDIVNTLSNPATQLDANSRLIASRALLSLRQNKVMEEITRQVMSGGK